MLHWTLCCNSKLTLCCVFCRCTNYIAASFPPCCLLFVSGSSGNLLDICRRLREDSLHRLWVKEHSDILSERLFLTCYFIIFDCFQEVHIFGFNAPHDFETNNKDAVCSFWQNLVVVFKLEMPHLTPPFFMWAATVAMCAQAFVEPTHLQKARIWVHVKYSETESIIHKCLKLTCNVQKCWNI